MGKTRGPYKQYLYHENARMPSRTLRHQKAKLKIKNQNLLEVNSPSYNNNILCDDTNDYEELKNNKELANVTSSIKLPSSFDGLLNILVNKKDLIDYNKTWFCGYCLKHFQVLENRLQRSCSKCNTR